MLNTGMGINQIVNANLGNPAPLAKKVEQSQQGQQGQPGKLPLDLKYALALQEIDALKKAGVPLFAYGSFITVALNFIILAFVIFQLVKIMNRMKGVEPATEAPATPEDIILLREIRDNLKK